MADGIDFVVSDRVSPTIKAKLNEIANASDKTAAAQARQAASAIRAASSAAAAAERYAQANYKTSAAANANTVSHLKLVQAEQKTAQATLATATAQDKAALSALKLAQARDKAAASAAKQAAADKAASRAQMLGGIGAAVGGGVGGIGGAIKGAALGSLASGDPSSMAAGGIVLAAGAGISTLVEYGDKYAMLQNSLKNVTGSLETTGSLMVRLNEIASATKAPLDAVAEGYGRFYRALQPLGKSQEEVLAFQQTLNTMLFQYGKTGSEAASATLQLTQAMGKGKLDGDEFRSVMENLPELGTAIARELGVMKGELLELAPAGAITGEVIYNAMIRAKEGLDSLPEPAATVGGALTLLENSATLFFGGLEKQLGIVAAMTSALTSMADAMGFAAKSAQNAATAGLGLKDAADVLEHFKVPEEFQLNDELLTAADRLAKAYRDQDDFNKNASRGNIAQRTQALEIAKAESVELYNQVNAIQDRLKSEAQLAQHQREAADKSARDEASKKPKGGGGPNAAALAEKKYQAELLQLRKEYVAVGIKDYESGIRAQGVELSKAQLAAEKDIASELGRQFDQQQALNDAQAEHVMRAEYLADLHKAIAESVKQAADTPPIGFANDNTSPTGISSLEEARLDEQTGVAANMRTRDRFLGESGKGNAMGEDFYAPSGQLIDLDKARKERTEANKKTPDNDPYLAKKDLDKRTEQLGDYGTDFEFQAQAREDLYKRIEELQQKSLLNEQEVANARMRIWKEEQDSKLNLATSFFSNFEGLMASKNKEMFAIGQAAAIANATINTYQAATAAYASLAGIPFVGPALGAAAAAGAIASGLANVANIAAQQPAGFKEGGYTGNIPANDVAGVVHGREYVMDAATTSRLGRHNLDALRSGDAQLSSGQGGGNQGGSGGAQPIVNVAIFGSAQDAKTWLQSRDGARVLVDVIGQNAVSVKNRLKAAG